MGGRASGPEPLERVFEFVVRTFKRAVDEGQKRLNSLQCHDIVCMIGDCIVVGGVRRSALISLSNLSDQRMRDCKSGEWHMLEPQRRLANNSVAYTETPEVGQWMEEWMSLYKSKSGERGIFNRVAAREQAMKSGRRQGYRTNGVGEIPWDFGVNPCGEIILRPMEFCNLTTTVVTPEDTEATLEEKVRLATILGTWQSTLTDFRYIRKGWKTNCEEERLLGVSMTGIMSNRLLNRPSVAMAELLDHLRDVAVASNKEWAERLGIPQSAAVTCVKPEGTASQLVGGPSGMHPEYAPFYVRRVRQDRKDPLTQLMIDEGVPHEVDAMNPEGMVFSFPKAAPEGCTTRHDLTAKQQLDHWLMFRNHWCEHNPSITVDVKEKEWPGVGAWVWDHFADAGGLTFMPNSDHSYAQAPYEEITESQYETEVENMPEISWGKLGEYENEDNTDGGRELACTAGACAI
jgi:ribonucleoside-diphosphate reductase alpha chain